MKDQKVRVLIAEDDYLVREELKRALRKLSCELVGEANNGAEALQMVQELKPDIVLMDIKMPIMDGLEATALIQDKCPTPVVILTAYETQTLVEQSSEAGVAAYLTKPPDSSEIQRAITIALARHNDMVELRKVNLELSKALKEIKTLRGILPMCCVCGLIRDDTGVEPGMGAWMKVDTFVHRKTDAKVSHGYCPKCFEKAMEGL